MDLADAYDEVDTVAEQEEDSALAAVTAATAIGGADESAAGEDAEGDDTAVAPLEISKEMKDTLKGLKFKAREIDLLRPEIATELAEKGLQRPQEGIPQNWLVEGASIGVSAREQALKISVLLAALGGLAFVGGKGGIGGLIAGESFSAYCVPTLIATSIEITRSFLETHHILLDLRKVHLEPMRFTA